jgi:hypothetical protein
MEALKDHEEYSAEDLPQNPFDSERQQELHEQIAELEPELAEVRALLERCSEGQRMAIVAKLHARVAELVASLTTLGGAGVAVYAMNGTPMDWQNMGLGALLGLLGVVSHGYYARKNEQVRGIQRGMAQDKESLEYKQQYLAHDIKLLMNEVRAEVDAALLQGGAHMEGEQLIATLEQKEAAQELMEQDLAQREE